VKGDLIAIICEELWHCAWRLLR